ARYRRTTQKRIFVVASRRNRSFMHHSAVTENQKQVDIAANRRMPNYTDSEMVLRALWIFGAWLYRLTPGPCFAARRGILRLFGAEVGEEANLHASTRIYFPWNLSIGDWSAVGEDALI